MRKEKVSMHRARSWSSGSHGSSAVSFCRILGLELRSKHGMKRWCISLQNSCVFITGKPVHNICVPSLLEQKVFYGLLILLMACKLDNEQNLRNGERLGSFSSLCCNDTGWISEELHQDTLCQNRLGAWLGVNSLDNLWFLRSHDTLSEGKHQFRGGWS